MTKKLLMMLAAALICSTMNMLIACTGQRDKPVGPDAGETFSIVTLNVDGLPAYIDATPIGMGVMPLNVKGPGDLLNGRGWINDTWHGWQAWFQIRFC